MLTSELQKLSSQPRRSSTLRLNDNLRNQAVVSPAASQSSSRQTPYRQDWASQQRSCDPPRKRRRVDSCGNPNVDLVLPLEESLECTSTNLPSPELMEQIIDKYFDVIQPWIPILHETQFRRRIQEQQELPHLTVVLHAMVVVALRFVASEMPPWEIESLTARSRNIVVLTSMDGLSVENSQALIIVAFNDVSNSRMLHWMMLTI